MYTYGLFVRNKHTTTTISTSPRLPPAHTGFLWVGGYQGVLDQYPTAYPNTTVYHMAHPELNYSYTACGKPPENAFHLVRSPEDPDLPWPGVFFGLTVSAVWYWCSDQVSLRHSIPPSYVQIKGTLWAREAYYCVTN